MNQPNNSNPSANKNKPSAPGQNRNPNSKYRNNRRRYRGNANKAKSPNPSSNLDRLVEKYINLLDQHLIARRKFHDLYFRADNAQLNKLERNFYSTLNDLRDFESKLPPESKEIFEQRINGLKLDLTYSTNHNIDINEKIELDKLVIEDPHLLQSQIKADYSNDVEESVGSIEDYNKYKTL